MKIKECKCEDCGNTFEIKYSSSDEATFCCFCSTEIYEIQEDDDIGMFYNTDDEDDYED